VFMRLTDAEATVQSFMLGDRATFTQYTKNFELAVEVPSCESRLGDVGAVQVVHAVRTDYTFLELDRLVLA
jgi:hypothetical protein